MDEGRESNMARCAAAWGEIQDMEMWQSCSQLQDVFIGQLDVAQPRWSVIRADAVDLKVRYIGEGAKEGDARAVEYCYTGEAENIHGSGGGTQCVKYISNVAFFFSDALIILIPRKVKDKRKVPTSQSYVLNLGKSHNRGIESIKKVQNKLDLK